MMNFQLLNTNMPNEIGLFDQLFNGSINTWEFLLVLGLSFVLGLIMYFVYLFSFRGVVYSQPFNSSLVPPGASLNDLKMPEIGETL